METLLIKKDLTENQNILQIIYKKVDQLRKQKEERLQKYKQKQCGKTCEPIFNDQLKIKIYKFDELLRRRKQNQQKNQHIKQHSVKRREKMWNKVQPKIDKKQLRMKTKSQKIVHFLKTYSNEAQSKKRKVSPHPNSKQNDKNLQMSLQKPIRKITTQKCFRTIDTMITTQGIFPNRVHAQNISSVSQFQEAEEQKTTSNKVLPKRYLKRGQRTIQTLIRQLQGSVSQQVQMKKQLIYLKEYDQWVPMTLATHKKSQLEHYLKILMGGKKNRSTRKSPIFFEPLYL